MNPTYEENEKVRRIREQIPSVEQLVFLNTGTCGPVPRVCADAMQASVQAELNGSRASIPGYMSFLDKQEELRTDLAALVGCQPLEMALTHHTTEGMNTVLWGMAWQPGDEIITTHSEHMGLLIPLSLLHQRFGVQVRYLPLNGDEAHDVALLEQAMNSRTRLFALSHVDYLTGIMFPLASLAACARAQGVPILVDGAQSVGVFPVDVQSLGVDFYAFPGQKWLCSPEGTGGLFVREDWIPRVQPVWSGTFSIRDIAWFDPLSPYFVPADGARRYQYGGVCRSGFAGWMASLRYLRDEVGWSWIFSRIRSLTQRAYKRLKEEVPGIRMVAQPEQIASLVAFELDGWDAKELSFALEERGLQVRYVPGPRGIVYVRASFGFYNNEEDLSRLIQELVALYHQAQNPSES